MKKLRTAAFALASLAAFTPHAVRAQALPTAVKSGTIQAGAGAMYLNNDYTQRKNAGPMIYVDYDFARLFRVNLGLEAEARYGGIYSPDDVGENSYLIGPRVSVRRENLKFYAKLMVGRGTIFHNSNTNNTSSSYNLAALGGGLEYRIKERFNIRVIDAEAQYWPGFPPNGLAPIALSAGLAYIIR